MQKNGNILVALSGGIDSAATVLMLREHGFSPVGLYIDMLGSENARNQAIDVARMLNIELIIEDIADEFRNKIIDFTLGEHQSGRTPSPCAMCNPLIKWAVTERVADRLGIFNIATGHYVRIENGAIRQGIDPTKDQSYYLWGLTAQTLKRALTPLGGYTKLQVREYLRSHGGFDMLASGGESMSICFIGKTPYNEFLSQNLQIKEGDVVDTEGVTIGRHNGYQLYTIGQKKGFTGGGAVIRVDAQRNVIVTTTDQTQLYTNQITIRDWVMHHQTEAPLNVKVRGLGRNPQSFVQEITRHDDLTMTITLAATDAWAVADGQPLVLYCGDMVVGGGIITNQKRY